MALLKYFKPTSEVYSCQKHQATILEEKEPTVSKKNSKGNLSTKFNDQRILNSKQNYNKQRNFESTEITTCTVHLAVRYTLNLVLL